LALQTYYEAVVNENWNYTYDHLGSQTRQEYNRDEWVQKNQLFAVRCPIKRTVPKIDSKVSPSEVSTSVTLIFTNLPYQVPDHLVRLRGWRLETQGIEGRYRRGLVGEERA
jgi:hypothetical protein